MLSRRLLQEVLWILIGLVVAAAITLPPYFGAGSYLYLQANVIIVFSFVYCARLLFFHRESLLLQTRASKGIASILVVPGILFTILSINTMQNFVDANSLSALFSSSLATDPTVTWGRYVRNEFLFFGAGLVLTLLLLPVVLIRALWQQVKRTGTQSLPPVRANR